VPTPTDVTKPPVPIVATEPLVLLHTPPPVASVKVSVPPRQIVAGLGLIGVIVLTVTIAVVIHPVPKV